MRKTEDKDVTKRESKKIPQEPCVPLSPGYSLKIVYPIQNPRDWGTVGPRSGQEIHKMTLQCLTAQLVRAQQRLQGFTANVGRPSLSKDGLTRS